MSKLAHSRKQSNKAENVWLISPITLMGNKTMLNKILRLLIITSLASLAACGGGDSTPPAAGVTVMAVDGNTVVLDSAYSTTCYYDNGEGKNKRDTHAFSGNTLTVTGSSWPGNDACANSETVDYTYVLTISTGSDIAITGWADGGGSDVGAPTAADNSGTDLKTNETVTTLTGTVTSVDAANPGLAVGDVITFFYVVDNSGAEAGTNDFSYLYRDKDYAAGDTRATAVDRLAI